MIDEVREKPERERQWYVYGCVAATMVLVLGIWLLSVTESFHSVASETPALKEQVMQALPQSPDTTSLSGLLEQGKSLQVPDKGVGAEDFFESQLQPAAQNTPEQ